jgi:hypothetical protein
MLRLRDYAVAGIKLQGRSGLRLPQHSEDNANAARQYKCDDMSPDRPFAESLDEREGSISSRYALTPPYLLF